MPNFTHILRPQTLEEFHGQTHLLGKDGVLRQLIEQKSEAHMFIYGPPGTGKTSLARIISKLDDRPFYEFNATSIKIEDIRKIIKQYSASLMKPTLFIDEVHRLSKNQQEVLLPYLENNDILFIGASTENPYHSVTAAFRSRTLLFEFHSLTLEELEGLVDKATQHAHITLDTDAKEYLLRSSGGDARAMLKLLEFAHTLDDHITLQHLKSIRPTALSDGTSEDSVHYDLISAMIKSIRGSDENAAIYYLARLIIGGENPEFIARRLVILASEDIGNANPQALTLCNSTMQSVAKIGYPESRIILAQAVIYLCASPKSNSAYKAINEAMAAVQAGEIQTVPKHINGHTTNYLYPHDYPNAWVEQAYMEKPLHFVELKEVGYEKKMKEWLQALKTTR